MNRRTFLITALAGLGYSISVSSLSMTTADFQKPSIPQLLGLDSSHLITSPIELERETLMAFLKMRNAAQTDGITLQIVSGYRSFDHQKQIWESKYNSLTKHLEPSEAISEIITYSSIPGTSRHHWGTDIDLIDGSVETPKGDVLLEKHYHNTGVFAPMRRWMQRCGSDFGFELVYPNQKTRPGFGYEPWHYSFQPTSKTYLQTQLSDDFYDAWNQLEFKGKGQMSSDFISTYFQNYSLGINPDLIPS